MGHSFLTGVSQRVPSNSGLHRHCPVKGLQTPFAGPPQPPLHVFSEVSHFLPNALPLHTQNATDSNWVTPDLSVVTLNEFLQSPLPPHSWPPLALGQALAFGCEPQSIPVYGVPSLAVLQKHLPENGLQLPRADPPHASFWYLGHTLLAYSSHARPLSAGR